MSTKLQPTIKLEEGENLVLIIKRSPIPLILLWAGEAIAMIILIVLHIFFAHPHTIEQFMRIDSSTQPVLFFIIYLLAVVLLAVGLISTTVYRRNILFVTNKRLIQEITTSLFVASTNVISLRSIEDISFRKSGLWDYLLHIGSIRFSTVGDETTYTFRYVDTPQDEMETITHLVHEAKNHYRQKQANVDSNSGSS